MPPSTSCSVPGFTPMLPDMYSVLPTRTASENGKLAIAPVLGMNCGCCAHAASATTSANTAVKTRRMFMVTSLKQDFFDLLEQSGRREGLFDEMSVRH